LLAISFFITKKFKFQQLAADIADFSIAIDAVSRRRAARPTSSIAREFPLGQAVELKQVQRRLAGAKRGRCRRLPGR
jgi:hypothetical protein